MRSWLWRSKEKDEKRLQSVRVLMPVVVVVVLVATVGTSHDPLIVVVDGLKLVLMLASIGDPHARRT